MNDEDSNQSDRQRNQWDILFDPRAVKIIGRKLKLEKIELS